LHPMQKTRAQKEMATSGEAKRHPITPEEREKENSTNMPIADPTRGCSRLSSEGGTHGGGDGEGVKEGTII